MTVQHVDWVGSVSQIRIIRGLYAIQHVRRAIIVLVQYVGSGVQMDTKIKEHIV